MSDGTLLAMSMRDLGVSLEDSAVWDCVLQLWDELAAVGLRVRPHVWLSDEWFTPTDIPGIAVPFYLSHPRLVRLERRMMLEAEGATRTECMKLLRHEAGHCVRVAYRLQRRRSWQNVFGRAAKRYPVSYKPKPYSRHFVQHLDNYYAQAHPDEDFAETFAVWLTPGALWRRRYQAWPAITKLEYVDDLMAGLVGVAPDVRTRRRSEPIARISRTLAEHYEIRRRAYGVDQPDIYLRDLRTLFVSRSDAPKRSPGAASFLRRERGRVVRSVSRWTNQYPYTVDSIYRAMIERCHAADLVLPAGRSEEALRLDVVSLVSVLTMNEINVGGRRIRL